MTEESENGDGSARSDMDPFEALGADVTDRDGDPFEMLSETAETDSWHAEDERTSDSDTAAEPSAPSESAGADSTGSPDEERDWFDAETRDEAALTGLLSDVGNRSGDPFEKEEDLFDEMETEALDTDSVWQELESAQSRGSVDQSQQRTYADVSKHSYCEQCTYFSDPPEIKCQHEEAEIVEFLDMETVRVVDCPVVAERQELERG